MNFARSVSPVIRTISSSALAIAAVTSLAPPAAAQAQTVTAADSADRLGEIVVTAEKHEESLQKTPIAISVATAAQLQQQNITSLLDIGQIAPNVMTGSQSATGSENGGFFIRGIGQDRSGITFDQGVGVYVDDIYMSRSDSSFLSIIDVDRIEVLRGPQGTLFGKNTIGGAIRYITKQPDDKFGGYLDMTGGSLNRADIKASVNLPLTDNLFVKVTGGALNRDGYIDHETDDKKGGSEDIRFGRVQVRWKPTTRLTVDLSGSKTISKNDGRAYIIDYINPNDSYPQKLNQKTGVTLDNTYASPNDHTIYGGDNSGYYYNGYTLSAVVTDNLTDNLTLKSITGYIKAHLRSMNDWDGTPYQLYDIDDNRHINQFSEELQLNGSAISDRLKYAAGVYYLHETPKDVSTVYTVNEAIWPKPRNTTQAQTVDSYAAFAEATMAITEKFSVTAGLRYSQDDKKASSTRLDTGYAGQGKGNWHDFSPRFSVQYQWTPALMTYATVAKGFRSGGINVLTSGPTNYSYQNYTPEIVWNYEGGIRTDLLDHHLRLNLTGFYMKYSNQQLTALNEDTNTVYIQNVGKAHRDGIEVETTIAPIHGLTLRGNLGYLQARYDDVGTATGVSENSRVLRSPRWTYTATAAYEFVTPHGSVTPALTYTYVARQSTTSTDSNTVLLAGYGVLNARLQYVSPGKGWSLAVFGTNLTSKTYFIGGIDYARRETLIGVSQLDVGRPREFGGNLRFNF